jgi:hypothetical protein
LGRVKATILDKDGKVRTEKGAKAAVDAPGIIDQFWGVIALGVGSFRHHEDALGAKLDAEAASFATLLNDLNHAARNLNTLPIQGLSPIAHVSSLVPCQLSGFPPRPRRRARIVHLELPGGETNAPCYVLNVNAGTVYQAAE